MKKFGDIFSPFHVINKYDRQTDGQLLRCVSRYT